jgi:hypothetical protein
MVKLLINKFPTDGDSVLCFEARKVRELRKQPIRCDSGTDSKVWMREDEQNVFQRLFGVWICTMTSSPGYFIRGFFNF